MRISTFTGLAQIFGKHVDVTVEKDIRGEGAPSLVKLTIGGLTLDEVNKILAMAEGGEDVKSDTKPATKPAAAEKPAEKAAAATKPAAAEKPAEKPAAEKPAAKPAAAAAKPAAKAAPAKAAPALDPAGPDDDDDDDAGDDDDGAEAGGSLDNDPWGLSSTPIPETLLKPDTKLREVIRFCQQTALAVEDVELTEEQIVTAITAIRDKVPAVGRIEIANIASRVKGCLQVMGAAGARPAATH